jgi:5S rRNA maturation endonuclease (ribonuclease M5)
MASTMSDADIIDSLLEWGYGESNPANDVGEPKEVIILTDWDKEGKLMERNLNKKLKAFGFRVNVEFRKKLFNIVGRDVKTVEDLPKFIESFEKW